MSNIWSKLTNLGGLITGTLGVGNGGTGLTSGTSGGVPYFSSTSAIASSGALSANQVVLGGGAGASPTVLAAGSANQLLHAGTPPTWSAVVNADVDAAAAIANSKLNLDPTTMADVQATALGLKTYSHGTTYNGGNAPTITYTSGGGTMSSAAGRFIPYETQDGIWHLKFTMQMNMSSTARVSPLWAVAGVSASATFSLQPFSTIGNTLSTYNGYFYSSGFEIDSGSITDNAYYMAGDVTLSAKPNWAY